LGWKAFEFVDLTENERTDFMGFKNSGLLGVGAKDGAKFKRFHRRLCRSVIGFNDMWSRVGGPCMVNKLM